MRARACGSKVADQYTLNGVGNPNGLSRSQPAFGERIRQVSAFFEGAIPVEIQKSELSDVTRYITNRSHMRLADKEERYDSFMRLINAVRPVTPETRMLEVGTGLGLFPIWCATKGWNCKGLEISPQLIAHAEQLAREEGVKVEIILGNIEDFSMPSEQFDVIIAASLFEHVPEWRKGLAQIYRWLKPGGLLLFESTNKFSFVSGEYQKLPLYGWLPNAARYKFRQIVHGPDIMQLGIDFHQFTHGGLRKAFRQLGFSKIYDRVDLANLRGRGGPKGRIMSAAEQVSPLRQLILTFSNVTLFVCIK
ncbi:MAG: class I SAM-dependent methyltransferase [Alphaproteobacteria bacterium]